MLKTKYEILSKEEKKEIQKKYKETESGKIMWKHLFRLQIIGCLGILYAGYLALSNIQNLKIKDYLMIIPLLFCSIFFLYMFFKLKKKVLNRYIIKQKN